MKKYISILLSVLLLTSCHNTISNQSSNQISSLSITETDSSDADESYVDIWDYTPPTSDDPMAICNIFPDPYFALVVARAIDKSVTDVVSFDELANFEGELYCGPSPLKSIEGIGYLTGITSFSCAKNDLEVIPSEFSKLTNITSINLMKAYSLKSIPSEIGNLKKLNFMRLDLTNLEELPEGIGDCKNLRILNLANTKITSVPNEIGNLENLEFLDMHNNNIESVPDSICKLAKLKILDISRMKLKSLPANIGNLSELERLDLFGSQLKSLPDSMKKLSKLRYLNVYDNFDLNENYKKWFKESVYSCTDDPEEDDGALSKWYYNKGA